MQLRAQLGGLALIVVDYGQLLQDSKGNNSTVEDQTLVSRNLKRMARALDVPLLVPVQINRQAGARGDQRPKLSDIRESGSWEQDADVVVGLYRDELVHRDSDDRGLLELIVLKNRHAGEKPPATFKAVWYRGPVRRMGSQQLRRPLTPRAQRDCVRERLQTAASLGAITGAALRARRARPYSRSRSIAAMMRGSRLPCSTAITHSGRLAGA